MFRYELTGLDCFLFSFSNIDLPSVDVDKCEDNFVSLGPSPQRRFCGEVTRHVSYTSDAVQSVIIQYQYLADRAGSGFVLDYIKCKLFWAS